MQNQDNLHPDPLCTTGGQARPRTREKTPIKDEFTEFSQYGSRFMLNQMEEKTRKEKNFVEQIQENKIFKKVASTCQKHYRKTSSTEQSHQQQSSNVLEQDISPKSPMTETTSSTNDKKVQINPSQDTCLATCHVPTAVPRNKKVSLKQITGEPEKLDPLQLERKAAMLFKKAEQCEPSHSVSMNTDPRGCWVSR